MFNNIYLFIIEINFIYKMIKIIINYIGFLKSII